MSVVNNGVVGSKAETSKLIVRMRAEETDLSASNAFSNGLMTSKVAFGDGVIVGIGFILAAVREAVAMAVGTGRVATEHPIRNIKSATSRRWKVFNKYEIASICI